jgi:hypothetical protein
MLTHAPVGMLFPFMIAHDKGKPVARQGRKAVNLPLRKIVWLPKPIEYAPLPSGALLRSHMP